MLVIYCNKYSKLIRLSQFSAWNKISFWKDYLVLVVVVVRKNYTRVCPYRNYLRCCWLVACACANASTFASLLYSVFDAIKWKCPTVLLQSTDFIMTMRLALIKKINFVHQKRGCLTFHSLIPSFHVFYFVINVTFSFSLKIIIRQPKRKLLCVTWRD